MCEKYKAEDIVPGWELFAIKTKYEEFKIAFQAELSSFNCYFVLQKGGFDTHTLLMWGENIFPADLRDKCPEALFDSQNAAKALAYELPTAVGFHLFRATECVLRRYYIQVTGGRAAPKVRNLGVYLNALKQSGFGDQKVLAVLKQLVDLHRNPLVHPEAVLSIDESIDLVGLCRSAVSAMLSELPRIEMTTETVPRMLENE